MKFEKSCGALIFRKNGDVTEVLLVHQTSGHWSFPKGHVEQGESEYDTAKREISEETGLEVEFIDGFREVETYSPAKNVMKDVVYFTARPTGGREKPQESEISELCWGKADDAAEVLTFESDAELFGKALCFINNLQEKKPS